MIVLDASAAIELVLNRGPSAAIDGAMRGQQVVVPAHFEADAYAGLRRMVSVREIERERVRAAVLFLSSLIAERAPLAPLLPATFELYDHFGAHDAFYAVLARERGATLVTVDAGLARSAAAIGVAVVFARA